MDLQQAIDYLGPRHAGVLITLRRDGRPQASNGSYAWLDGAACVSVTDDRAKTRNLRRDPRASMHVTSSDFWSYVVVDGTAELSPGSAATPPAWSCAGCTRRSAASRTPTGTTTTRP